MSYPVCYFDKYTLMQPLGEGSFGEVVLAQKNNELFAIKFSSENKGYPEEVLKKIFTK